MALMMRIVAASLAFLTAGVAGAQGQRVAVVVHGVGAGSDKAAGFVEHFVRTALEVDDRFSVVDLESALGSRRYRKAQRAFRAAEGLVEKGRTAYESLDLDLAVAHLNKALANYEEYIAYLRDTERVAEVLMLLGATHILRGEERLGAHRLSQAVTAYAEIEPAPRIFNPAMR